MLPCAILANIFLVSLFFCYYFTCLKALEKSHKIRENQKIFPILHSVPCDNNYLLSLMLPWLLLLLSLLILLLLLLLIIFSTITVINTININNFFIYIIDIDIVITLFVFIIIIIALVIIIIAFVIIIIVINVSIVLSKFEAFIIFFLQKAQKTHSFFKGGTMEVKLHRSFVLSLPSHLMIVSCLFKV